jgi:long-subunit acyl-CoA synthetase (AMP-forming)
MQMSAKDGMDKKIIGKAVFGEEFETIFSGGAYLSPEIVNGYKEFGIDISQGYGMTECSPRICTGIKHSPKPDSVGKIVNGCEVKIVDGEIWVKSKSVMKGYYKNPEETAKSLTPDGWLMTGDLGHKDDDGYLYITGRKKEILVFDDGTKLFLPEFEGDLRKILGQDADFAVLQGKDGSIILYIHKPTGIEEQIEKFNLAYPRSHRVAKIIYAPSPLPRTKTGKVQRYLITTD